MSISITKSVILPVTAMLLATQSLLEINKYQTTNYDNNNNENVFTKEKYLKQKLKDMDLLFNPLNNSASDILGVYHLNNIQDRLKLKLKSNGLLRNRLDDKQAFNQLTNCYNKKGVALQSCDLSCSKTQQSNTDWYNSVTQRKQLKEECIQSLIGQGSAKFENMSKNTTNRFDESYWIDA